MSTNYAMAKYQEIYDINTVSNSVSVIGIHTPIGAKPRQMLSGFFTQFRKYKYKGCSVVATPAQRLGLNLAQLSTEAGASTVNPKDVFNPALVRGCHGDNLNTALNTIYKGSFDNSGSSVDMSDYSTTITPVDLSWEQMYYRMLQDPSFKKFNLSSGIKISKLHPMVYNVAVNHQIMPNESQPKVGELAYDPDGGQILGFNMDTGGIIFDGEATGTTTNPTIQFMTNRLQSLGWLDTISPVSNPPGAPVALPKVMMAVIVLPPALSDSVVTSMRFVITHYFEFKEFNTSLTLKGASEYYDWLTTTSKDQKSDNNTLDTIGTRDSIDIVSDGVF